MRLRLAVCLAASLLTLSAIAVSAPDPAADDARHGHQHLPTATPIKHLVVIFQENVSFDHYFGTYPFAANTPGEPAFYAYKNTPSVNGFSAAPIPMRRMRRGNRRSIPPRIHRKSTASPRSC